MLHDSNPGNNGNQTFRVSSSTYDIGQFFDTDVQDEYILGWQGGYLGHPEREETRTTDAYDAGYEDGKEKNLSNLGNWKK